MFSNFFLTLCLFFSNFFQPSWYSLGFQKDIAVSHSSDKYWGRKRKKKKYKKSRLWWQKVHRQSRVNVTSVIIISYPLKYCCILEACDPFNYELKLYSSRTNWLVLQILCTQPGQPFKACLLPVQWWFTTHSFTVAIFVRISLKGLGRHAPDTGIDARSSSEHLYSKLWKGLTTSIADLFQIIDWSGLFWTFCTQASIGS